jgi:hypothetical protein
MTMSAFLRSLGAIFAAVATTFVLLIAVELFSAVVHPTPPDFKGTMEETCLHVARYPPWVLAVVIPMWAFIGFLSTWLAGRLGNRGCAAVVGFLFLAAVICNVAMLPYPLWFKVVQPIAVVIAIAYGFRLAQHRQAAVT